MATRRKYVEFFKCFQVIVYVFYCFYSIHFFWYWYDDYPTQVRRLIHPETPCSILFPREAVEANARWLPSTLDYLYFTVITSNTLGPPENHTVLGNKAKVLQLMQDAGVTDDPNYFLRVGVVGGGCSGLSYKLDFDNEIKPMDQVFEDNGVKIVTDLKSFLYLVNTELEFSDGLNGKGFYFNNPNASRSCGCGESFAV